MFGTAGFGFTVTDVIDEKPLEQLLASVTYTMCIPVESTVIDWVVAPLFHVYSVALVDVRITLPPSQNEIGPLAVIVGVEGGVFTVTVVVSEVALHPLLSV
jgi:hypothetical protein